MMKVQASVTINHNHTVADLRKAIEKVPVEAKITIYSYQGNQREPGYSTITFTWEV